MPTTRRYTVSHPTGEFDVARSPAGSAPVRSRSGASRSPESAVRQQHSVDGVLRPTGSPVVSVRPTGKLGVTIGSGLLATCHRRITRSCPAPSVGIRSGAVTRRVRTGRRVPTQPAQTAAMGGVGHPRMPPRHGIAFEKGAAVRRCDVRVRFLDTACLGDGDGRFEKGHGARVDARTGETPRFNPPLSDICRPPPSILTPLARPAWTCSNDEMITPVHFQTHPAPEQSAVADRLQVSALAENRPTCTHPRRSGCLYQHTGCVFFTSPTWAWAYDRR